MATDDALSVRRNRTEADTHQHDALWSGCGVLMQLGSRSHTLHYRAYAEALATGESVLAWASRRFVENAPVAAGLTIVCDGAEVERVAELQLPKSVAVCSATDFGDIYDARLYAEKAGVDKVLVGDITTALLPKRALQLLIQHHALKLCDATLLLDTPCTLAPCVINREFLNALTATVAANGVTLRVAIMMAAQSGVKTAATGSRVQCVSAQPLNLEHSCWPFRTRLVESEDVTVLRRVVSLAREAADDELLLRGWAPTAHAVRHAAIEAHPSPARAARMPEKPRPKVLFTQAPSAFTGVEQVVVTLGRRLNRGREIRYEMAALFPLAGVLTDRLQATGVDVSVADRDFSVPSIANYRYATEVLRAIAPSLIHAHGMVGVPLCTAIHDAGIPFIQHVHVADGVGLEQLEEQMSLADTVIAVSEFVKNQIRRIGIDGQKIHVIHNGIVKARSGRISRRAETRDKLRIPKDAPTVLVVARYAGNKRHDVSLDAYVRAQSRCPDLHLLMAGEAFAEGRMLAEDIARRSHRSGLRDQIRNVGFWPDMTELYDAADVYMLTSERDPLPLTVLEAMAHGVPVVATRSGGIPEMIEDGISGILMPPGQGQAFADGVERILSDDTFRSALISAATARVEKKFNVEKFVTSVRTVYSTSLGRASH